MCPSRHSDGIDTGNRADPAMSTCEENLTAGPVNFPVFETAQLDEELELGPLLSNEFDPWSHGSPSQLY